MSAMAGSGSVIAPLLRVEAAATTASTARSSCPSTSEHVAMPTFSKRYAAWNQSGDL